MQSLKETRFAQ